MEFMPIGRIVTGFPKPIPLTGITFSTISIPSIFSSSPAALVTGKSSSYQTLYHLSSPSLRVRASNFPAYGNTRSIRFAPTAESRLSFGSTFSENFTFSLPGTTFISSTSRAGSSVSISFGISSKTDEQEYAADAQSIIINASTAALSVIFILSFFFPGTNLRQWQKTPHHHILVF